MTTHVEILEVPMPRLVALAADRATIGAQPSNDIAIATDPSVSRLHAVLERYGAQWCIRDVGSRNGTFVNGERLLGEHVLHHGDEIRVGQTRLRFAAEVPAAASPVTQVVEDAPELTRRERQVLGALCRPVFSGDVFTAPASIRQIAAELYVTDTAVKQHLSHLYDKFAISTDGGESRRVRLANEAIRRGAVTLADLRADRE